MEPVRRLRQSREVKCGCKLVGDIDHGQHMEYLAEFSNGSSCWIPSSNVALDLKQEYWNVMTYGAREIAEIVGFDSSTGKVTVKRPDDTTKVIDQTRIFGHEEEAPTVLTDAELDALLHHGHFGIDVPDFMPCTVTITTDWAKVEISGVGATFMKDPAAEKAGEYVGIEFNAQSIRVGRQYSYSFISRHIPFVFLARDEKIDITIMHGRDKIRYKDKLGQAKALFGQATGPSCFA
ncbi:hypothetical protein PAXRUDRAFT_28625 [Paxillus rubicundulus Ve08.2h10]|uniref:Uncharacterized protein n=1 Tax=Paxillus rubicundulus Ve08.2h10 TaxID=930991 RepID=A0A0D0DJW6_9AGAM|nr:hypothetical protein PAXRUDRAFT_28625 [Paxillus rubicundulus Ve08.2h10]